MAALRSWDIKYLSEDGSVLLVGPFWDRRTCRRCIALCEEHGRWSNDPASRCACPRICMCGAGKQHAKWRRACAGTQAHRHTGTQARRTGTRRRAQAHRLQASGAHAPGLARSRTIGGRTQVPVRHM